MFSREYQAKWGRGSVGRKAWLRAITRGRMKQENSAQNSFPVLRLQNKSPAKQPLTEKESHPTLSSKPSKLRSEFRKAAWSQHNHLHIWVHLRQSMELGLRPYTWKRSTHRRRGRKRQFKVWGSLRLTILTTKRSKSKESKSNVPWVMSRAKSSFGARNSELHVPTG